MALEIFKLMGSILVDSDEAEKSISNTGDKAEGLGNKLLSGIGTAAKWGAGIAMAAGTAAIALGTVAVKSADEFQRSMNQLQASTGATNKEMKELENVVKGVYGNNFGENFDDVAKSVELVKQNLKLSGEELQKTTEYAIGFRDTFDVEVNESTRAAKALMDNFGLSSEEAFNLMVQGQQQGLNYSDELIDSISEYSVKFGQAGFDAEDMFNVLKAGADGGAFALDKVGDAFKEMTIKITAGDADEALTKLGFNAEDVARKIASGGEDSSAAFYDIYKAVSAIEDPLERQNTLIAMFGTMAEDMGMDATLSLMNFGDEFNRTINSAERLNEIKYNSFGEALEGIKRQVETNVFIPIGQTILPTLNNFANWFAEKGVPALQAFGDGVMFIFPYIQEGFTAFFNTVTGILDSLINVFLESTGNIGLTWQDFINILSQAWEQYGKPIFDAFSSAFQTISDNSGPILEGLGLLFLTCFDVIKVAWDTIGAPLFDYFISIIKQLADVFNEVFPIIAQIFSGLCETLSNLWESILKPIFIAIGDYIQNVLLPRWQNSFNTISTVVKTVFEFIGNLWNNSLKPILDGIINFIGGVFSGNWSQAWNGIVQVLQGLWGGIKTILWSPIEAFLGLLSGIGSKIAQPFKDAAKAIGDTWSSIKSHFKLPHFKLDGTLNPMKWVDEGMPKFSVDWYYKGGIFKEPTILGGIGVGDKYMGQGSNAEAVVPLDEMYSNIDSILQNRDNSDAIVPYLIKILEKINELICALDIKIDGVSLIKSIKDPLSEELAFDANRGR